MKLVIFLALFAALCGMGYYKFYELTRPYPVPKLDTNKYWGPGDGKDYKPDTSIKPFKLTVDQKEIDLLRKKLNRTERIHEPLEGARFEYGFNLDALLGIVKYWRDNYLKRWRAREMFINSLPQFTTEIQGLQIHFLHAKPTEEDAAEKEVLPLLLLHGWPSSTREFYDIIEMLKRKSEISDYVFEVVAPSLVGYGWSDPATKSGFNPAQMAIVMRNLMLRLGYKKFFVQGGDWGSVIGNNIATLFPENVIGFHANLCMLRTPLSFMKQVVAEFFPYHFIPNRMLYDHHFPMKEKYMMLLRESGYFHIQATKPDTIGLVLSTSPIALAAYYCMIFQIVTPPHLQQEFNALDKTYGLDSILDNIMIHYLTNSMTSAARLYFEATAKEYTSLRMDRVPTDVPYGCARFKNDIPSGLDWQLRDKYRNLTHSMYFNRAGHFVNYEEPSLLYIDINEFVTKVLQGSNV